MPTNTHGAPYSRQKCLLGIDRSSDTLRYCTYHLPVASSQNSLHMGCIFHSVIFLFVLKELAAYRVVVPQSGKNGLSLIKELYLLYSDDPEIVENICQLFNQMATYGKNHLYLIYIKYLCKENDGVACIKQSNL